MQVPADIDLAAFSKDLKELEKAIALFQAVQAQGGSSALYFEVLIRRINQIAEFYS